MDSRLVRADFLTLTHDIRKKIYNELFVVDHPIILYQHIGSKAVQTLLPDQPPQWLALLYTNRQIHDEGIAVLYGSNNFTFIDRTQHQAKLLQCFFNSINSVNAGLLTQICINFPVVQDVEGQPGKVKLAEDDVNTLKLLRENCTSLTILETLIHSRNSRRLISPSQDDKQFLREAMSQIDPQLKSIRTLNTVAVKCYTGLPSPLIIESMREFGWEGLIGDDE